MLDIQIPRSKAEFDEIRERWKMNTNRASPEFQAISRSNKLIEHSYLQTKDGAEMKYRPKFSQIESELARNLTINPEKRVFGKTPIKIPPACVADKE